MQESKAGCNRIFVEYAKNCGEPQVNTGRGLAKIAVPEEETPPVASSTMHPARSMSVGERMEIIGKLANPRRATGRFYCFPPPPKQLQHRMGTTPKWGRFGVPFAEHS